MTDFKKKIIISDLLTTDALINSIRIIYILMFVKDENFIADLSFYLTAAIFLFELPSGYFGDNFGNKKMVIYSKISFILAILCLLFFRTKITFALSYLLLGVYSAFESGAKNSYFLSLFDNDNEAYKKVKISIKKYSQIVTFIFAICSSVLFYINMYIPFVITIILAMVSVILIATLPKDDSVINSNERIKMLKSFKIILKDILSNKKFTFNIIYFTSMITILIYTFYYYSVFFVNNNVPKYMIGGIYATFSILGYIGIRLYQGDKYKMLSNMIKLVFPVTFILVISNNLILLSIGVIIQEIVFSMFLIDFEINTITEMTNRKDSSQFQSLVSFMYAIIRLVIVFLIAVFIDIVGFDQMFYIFAIISMLLYLLKIKNN